MFIQKKDSFFKYKIFFFWIQNILLKKSFFKRGRIAYPYIQGREQSLAIGTDGQSFCKTIYMIERSWIFISISGSAVWQMFEVVSACVVSSELISWLRQGRLRKSSFGRNFPLSGQQITTHKSMASFLADCWDSFFILRFYSLSGKVSVSAALPLSYLFQTGALETRIINCTVFSQTHAECTKKWEWTIFCQTWIINNGPVSFSGEDRGNSYEKRFSLALELEGREVKRQKRIFKILTIDLPAGSGTWLFFSHQITLGCQVVT